ncbi:MAG: GyrI-like domain-containing protein [Candidatus Lokiarchaeota archaeon]
MLPVVQQKELYAPSSKEVSIVDVPSMNFLMVNGIGSPGDSQEYQDALSILYPIAFKIKFLSKNIGRDYVVPPLEGLWWADDMKDFIKENRDKWKWTMMLMIPDWITKKIITEAINIIKEKKPELLTLIPKARFENYSEGKSAQIMHIGPYSEEGPTIKKLHNFIRNEGGMFEGQKQKHHEIYLSDPRRSKPQNMKTIIRQPFA